MGDGFTFNERRQVAAQGRRPQTVNVEGSEGPAPAPAGTKVDDLLKPTQDVAGDKFVHFGKMKVERDLVPEFLEAQRYLCSSPHGVNALYALEHAKTETTVHAVHDGNDSYDPNRGRINWDPKVAMVTADGKVQTAANSLLHEEGHAAECLTNNLRFIRQASVPNQRCDDGEEQRNVTWEKAYSKDLGEGGRTDHGGVDAKVSGPTSQEVLDEPMHDKAAIEKSLHRERFSLAVHGYNVPPAPGKGADAIVPWDGKSHSGPIVHLDGDNVAQYVADPKGGPGQYQVYDVRNDLHGVIPPENNPRLTIDAQGQVAGRTQAVPAAAEVGGR